MDPEELATLLSDYEVQNQLALIFEKAGSAFYETEHYYEARNPINRKIEGNVETVNFTEVLLRINSNLERIASRLEHK